MLSAVLRLPSPLHVHPSNLVEEKNQKQSFFSAPDSKALLYLRKIFPHSTASIGNFSNKECFLGQVEQPKKNSFGSFPLAFQERMLVCSLDSLFLFVYYIPIPMVYV